MDVPKYINGLGRDDLVSKSKVDDQLISVTRELPVKMHSGNKTIPVVFNSELYAVKHDLDVKAKKTPG